MADVKMEEVRVTDVRTQLICTSFNNEGRGGGHKSRKLGWRKQGKALPEDTEERKTTLKVFFQSSVIPVRLVTYKTIK